MKKNKKLQKQSTMLITALITTILIALTVPAHALELPETPHKAFLEEFVTGYQTGKTQYLTGTLRSNRRYVKSVVNALIKEAVKREFNERMELLDIANALASMHKHWNFDEEPLKLVEAAIEREMAKKRERAAEAAKWASYEKFAGNVLYRTNPAKLKSAGVAPVLFPHWKHRLLYECAACHDSLFKIDRSSRNPKRPSLMHQPTYCGACHDSTTAFGIANSKENCARCHSAGLASEERQVYNGTPAQNDILKKAGLKAVAVGGIFKPEKLKEGLLPTDRFDNIDWVTLKKSGAYRPVTAAKAETEKTISHTASVLFEVPDTASWIGPAPFRHKSHTPAIECATCHASLFGKDLKAAKIVTMQEMAKGKSCGVCHNRVAFKLADCMRCHTNSLTENELKSFLKREKVE